MSKYIYGYAYFPETDTFALIFREKIIYENNTMMYTKVNGCDKLNVYDKNDDIFKFSVKRRGHQHVNIITTDEINDNNYDVLRDHLIKFMKEEMYQRIEYLKDNLDTKIDSTEYQLRNLQKSLDIYKEKREKISITEEYVKDLNTKAEIMAKWLEMEREYGE